jgi:hypothetical protein
MICEIRTAKDEGTEDARCESDLIDRFPRGYALPREKGI